MNVAAIPREFLEVPLSLIDAPPLPARSTMDEIKLDELTDSIRRNGVVQPLALARRGERFDVIAGHRRSLASRRAGLVVVPAIVYPNTDAALEAIKFAENRHREELNPADEAIYFSELLEQQCDGDTDKLCALVGEKRPYVEGRLLLFRGDSEVFEALQAGRISIGVAHQLNKCTAAPYRRYLLHQAVVGGATVAVVSGWIMDWKNQQSFDARADNPAPIAPPSGAVVETNYFTCKICGRSDNVHLMRPINVHAHCELAILDPLLASD